MLYYEVSCLASLCVVLHKVGGNIKNGNGSNEQTKTLLLTLLVAIMTIIHSGIDFLTRVFEFIIALIEMFS